MRIRNPLSSTSRSPANVLWVGRNDSGEFGPCYADLLSAGPIQHAEDAGQGVAALASGEVFDQIVFAFERPLIDPTAATALIESAGETPIVQLLGVWCEGEGRTGTLLPGVERLFWHEWPAWRQGQEAATPKPLNGPVWIQSADGELADAIALTLADEQIASVWAPNDAAKCPACRVESPSVVICDAQQLGGQEADRLARVCRSACRSETPVMVLLDFPRPETVAAAIAVGAAAVLGKPFRREALLTTLGRMSAERGAPPQAGCPSAFTAPTVEPTEELRRVAA